MEKEIKKVVIGFGGVDYPVQGGGVGPDTVGSEEIKNDSIRLEDLSPEVKALIESGGSATEVVVPCTEPVTSVDPEIGKYYRFDFEVDKLDVTLPPVESTGATQRVGMYFTTGDHPDVTFASSDGKDVSYSDGYHIEPNKNYEISARFNGVRWVVTTMLLVGFFMFVSPKETIWVTPDMPVSMTVSSNDRWAIK